MIFNKFQLIANIISKRKSKIKMLLAFLIIDSQKYKILKFILLVMKDEHLDFNGNMSYFL